MIVQPYTYPVRNEFDEMICIHIGYAKSLTLGKLYKIIYIREHKGIQSCMVINDLGVNRNYYRNWFMTIKEHREKLISEIISNEAK